MSYYYAPKKSFIEGLKVSGFHVGRLVPLVEVNNF